MTPADHQLIEWCQARGVWLGKTSLAVGYLLAKAQGREVSKKLAKECEEVLAALRTHRLQELGR